MKQNRLTVLILGAIVLSTALMGCGTPTKYDYLISGNNQQKTELTKLFKDLEASQDSPESRFILNQQIIRLLHENRNQETLNLYLTQYTTDYPDDPFNGYYLLLVAQNYKRDKADPMAVHYYQRILNNSSDLIVENQSTHFICLKNLINLIEDPELRVTYYKDLISRFGGKVEMGPTYYYLGKSYEAIGEWDLSIQAYKNFLRFPGAQIPGAPQAYEEIKELIAFYDYRKKTWTYDDLDELVRKIKWAMATRNIRYIHRYRSQVNFFAVSWEQKESMASDEFLSGLSTFMGKKLRYRAQLDPDSNSQEAYLETWGWSHRISTWYLYFRRVNLPSDPEIHNQWEWAGIYFGEKPFTGKE